MTLPTRADWTAAANEGVAKGLFGDEVEFIARMLGGTAATELTISGGGVTAVGALHSIDVESGSADDLDAIDVSALDDGALIAVYLEDATRLVTMRHEQGGSGQLSLMRGENLTMKSALALSMFRIVKGSPDTLYEVMRATLPDTVYPHTAGATLTHSGDNEIDTNAGASGSVALTLPPAVLGRRRRLFIEAAFNTDYIPGGSDTIFDGVTEFATGVKNAVVGSHLELVCSVAGTWRLTTSFGTWAAV